MTESDGYLYSVGEIPSKHKGIGIRLDMIQYGVRRNESSLHVHLSMHYKDQ